MKRKEALRKIRTICQRLDDIDLDTFPIWPIRLYLFGSVLTDKSDPNDVDMALVYQENPKIKYSNDEILYMLSYEPRLQPQNRANVSFRRGMKKVKLYMTPSSITSWSDLILFPAGEGLRLIWKQRLPWEIIIDDIESNPAKWLGPRPEDAKQKAEDEWETLAKEEQEARIAQTLAALETQERNYP